ncbi:MAG: hypothetical protein RL563_2080 [Pseudomonadota bacterium]
MPLSSSSLLTIESRHIPYLIVILIVLAVSGFSIWLGSSFSVLIQCLVLLHALLGLLFSWFFIPYLWLHFRRTLGQRRPAVILSGVLSSVLFIALIASGLYLLIQGQSEALSWLLPIHIIMAVLILLGLSAHVWLHVSSLSDKRKQQLDHHCPSLGRGVMRSVSIGLLLCLSCVAWFMAFYALRAETYDDSAAIKPYRLPYGEHPFRPSQTETSSAGFLDARRLGDSARCAACHQEIAQQWQVSMHAQAAADRAYQTNIKLLMNARGIEATRYCEGCHAPVALLSGQLSQGGRLDTPGHLHEGVSCMSCHAIAQIEHLQGVASYRVQSPTPYLFEGDQQGWAVFIHDLLIRLKPEQHKADLARPILGSPELCATCHAQFMDQDFNHWGWVKMQDDYQSWLNGPYSSQYRQYFAQARQKRCQDCHFPLQPGHDPSANQDGLIKSHFNVGANTAIPWLTQNQPQLQRTIEFLRQDRLRISIDRPNRNQATLSQRPMDSHLMPSTEAPAYAYLGEEVSIDVTVSNAQVGHAFPGGTTDINEAWLRILVTDAQGLKVYESGYLDSDNNVEAAAHFYRSIPIDRAGNAVWRHDLFNMVGDSFKRVIPAGGSDLAHYRFHVPDDAKGSLHISVCLRYRKLNNRYARWAFGDEKIALPIVDMASASLSLPIKIKSEVFADRLHP